VSVQPGNKNCREEGGGYSSIPTQSLIRSSGIRRSALVFASILAWLMRLGGNISQVPGLGTRKFFIPWHGNQTIDTSEADTDSPKAGRFYNLLA